MPKFNGDAALTGAAEFNRSTGPNDTVGYHFIMGLMGLKALFILCITKSLSQWVFLKGLMKFWQVDVSRVLVTAVFLKNSMLYCRNRKIK